MRVFGKRIVSFLLMLCLSITSIAPAYADTGMTEGGGWGSSWKPGPHNPNWKPVNSTFKTWGYRITITTPDPIMESNVPELGETFTAQDLKDQYDSIAAIVEDRYWEPGVFGLNFYKTKAGRNARFLDSIEAGFSGTRPGIQMSEAPANPKAENPLAWMFWVTPDKWDRTQGVPDYNEAVASFYSGEQSKLAGDPETWMSQLRQAYNAAPGNRPPRDVVTELVGNGQGMSVSFPYFQWATNDPVSGAGTPYEKVIWSRMGHLAMCIMFAWAAQDIGDTATYTVMRDSIARWVSSDYASQNMPILMVEATSGVNADGDPNGSVDFCTLPYCLDLGFAGNGAAELFYHKWPETAKGSTQQGLLYASNGKPINGWGGPALNQGVGGHPNGGAWIEANANYKSRSYLRHVGPREGNPELYGYFVNWTYWTDGLPPPPDTDEENAFGSFTWKLTPDGVHDKTPEKEVNESSTIYELNISQDNYNANNYQKWNSVVRADGIDCNKLRIRIYHISENLAEEQPATKYARDSVKQKGAEVTTPVNKVTISPTGNITGFPAGTIITPFSTPF